MVEAFPRDAVAATVELGRHFNDNSERTQLEERAMDVLAVVKYANYVGITLVAITALWLTMENSASRNMVIATGALLGALLLFVVQVTFELRGATTYDHITAEFVIDRSKTPSIVLTYPPTAQAREGEEIRATLWLSESNPSALDQDLGKYGRDLSLFSLISFLGIYEQDWHGTARYGIGGHKLLLPRIPQDTECSFVTKDELKAALSKSGNLFAEVPLSMTGENLCLPPGSTIEISDRDLKIRNPICQVSFSMGGYAFLRTNDLAPSQSLGEETFIGGWQVETKFFDNRAQNRMSSKYREWASRVVEGVHQWFEGTEVANQ